MIISIVAEGSTEKAVAERLLPFCGHAVGTVYGERGCKYIRQNATAFRWLATETTGVLILTDFRDTGMDCVPAALQEYIFDKLPNPPSTYICRFSVNEIESWLLADRDGLAKYLDINISRIPLQPECEPYPKRTLINLARKSKKRLIREGIAPPPGHLSSVGPEYMPLMRGFISDYWDIGRAIDFAPSLKRCVYRLQELTKIEEMGVQIMSDAIEAFRHVAASPELREAERMRSKARHDEAQALYNERRKKALEIAKKLLEVGDSIEKIISVTGLTREEIESIR